MQKLKESITRIFSFCSACIFKNVLFYKNKIVIHYGENVFLFYFDLCVKFTLSTKILTMKKWVALLQWNIQLKIFNILKVSEICITSQQESRTPFAKSKQLKRV